MKTKTKHQSVCIDHIHYSIGSVCNSCGQLRERRLVKAPVESNKKKRHQDSIDRILSLVEAQG